MDLDLYVMQTEHGLVKVGRSSDAARRALEIRKRYRCEISVLLVLPGRGNEEEAFHIGLESHMVSEWSKEWFSGSDECRAAIAALVGATIEWPHLLDQAKVEGWLASFEDVQADSSFMSRRRKVLRMLKGAEIGMGAFRDMMAGHIFLDSDIWYEIDGRSIPAIEDDGAFYYVRSGKKLQKFKIPPYTSDWDTAWSLWDHPDVDQTIPPHWLENFGQARNPIACCVAALGVRWGFDFMRLKPKGGR